MVRHRVVLGITCLLGLGASARAQELLWQQVGVPGQVQAGAASVFIGDVDGDGADDVVSISARVSPPFASEFHVRSGRGGSLLRVDAPTAGQGHRQLTAAGDVDGDGVRDYAFSTLSLTSNPFLSALEMRSGATGALLWRVTGSFQDLLGDSMVGDVDLNGDGRPDLLAAAPGENGNQGALHAYDHLGRPLWTKPGLTRQLGRLGGDHDGDGAEDFLRGGPTENLRGGAFLHSGRTGQVLLVGFGERMNDGMGLGQVTGCGDVDGDGILDFVGSSSGSTGTPGLVMVFSGVDGTPIYTWRRPVGSLYGKQLAVGDLDLDGVQDLLIGPAFCLSMPTTSAIEWRSLRTGQIGREFCAPDPVAANFGFAPFAIGRPQPGHPFPVIAVGEPQHNRVQGVPLGRLNFYRATAPNVQPLGGGCAGRLAREPVLGFVDLGPTGAQIHVSGAPAGATALLLLGVSSTSWAGQALPFALDPLGLFGCALSTSVEVVVPVVTGTAGIGAGFASVALPLPLNGGLAATVHGQWMVLDGSGGASAVSAGLSWRH